MGLKNLNKTRRNSGLKPQWLLVLSVALLLSVFTVPMAQAHGPAVNNAQDGGKAPKQPDPGKQHAQAELIVRTIPAFPLTQDIVKAFHATILDQFSDLNIYRIGYDPTKTEADEIAQVAAYPQVQYIDFNYTDQTPTGNPAWAYGGFLTAYQQQYAANLLEASAAQQISQGTNVTVAVLDTGIDLTHPLLASHLVSGYDYVSNSSSPADVAGGVASGHGSAVAGLVLLSAPQAKIMPIRVLDTNGQGALWNILKGIRYASDNGAQVINMSLGTTADTSSLRDLIGYAQQKNVVTVASAGNDNTSTPQYPCAVTGVLCVAATDSTNLKASFSNYGSFVGISAPGIALYSSYYNDGYATWSGTSMASPLVAGGAALVKAQFPTLTSAQITAKLQKGTNSISSFNPLFPGLLGTGELDLYRALTN